MRFRILLSVAFAALVCCTTMSPLAADDGRLDPALTANLRHSLNMDGPTQALLNALTATDAKKLAVNRAIVQGHNDLFNHRIKTKGITDQKKSGRCWLFAGLNMMRPAVIEKYKLDEFEFSLNYLAFWDKLEKANFFLETVIDLRQRDPLDRELDYFLKDPIGDGGWWDYVVALVDKYGVVPNEVMTETYPSENTDVMNDVLAAKLRVDAAQLRRMAAEKKSVGQLREAKRQMLREVYRILVMNYGQPPAQFVYRYADKNKKVSKPKTYTPQSFYKDWVGVDLSQYVQVCNDPTHPYQKHYRLRRLTNMVGSPEVHYANVPIDALKNTAVKSIIDREPVDLYGDEKADMDRDKGIMQVGLYDYGKMYSVDLTLSKADRMRTRQGGPGHVMVFIGVDIQDNKPVKWLVENSWGKEHGKNGLWTMYDNWFDEHVYGIIVKKAYVPNSVLKIFQEEPVELPPWTPINTSSD
jgi:bleomycin hydrolase